MRVITVDGKLAEVKLPLPMERLVDVGQERSCFNNGEEEKAIAWGMAVSVSDMPFPMSEDRCQEILNSEGSRSKSSEDYEVARWVIKAYKIIEKMVDA